MMNQYIARVVVSLWVLAVSIVGCGSSASTDGVGKEGEVVGGPCTAGSCAAGSECILGGDFPSGMCAVNCAKDADCPTGSVCISNEGGICMLPCTSNSDCRDGYVCEGKSLEDGDGEANVCNG